MSTPELRKRLKAWYSACARVDALRRRICADPTYSEIATRVFMNTGKVLPRQPLPDYPPFPPECVDMRCGAKAKSSGEPCKSTLIYPNGRCKYHGGTSTGPKSKAGKLAALKNLKWATEPQGLPYKSLKKSTWRLHGSRKAKSPGL